MVNSYQIYLQTVIDFPCFQYMKTLATTPLMYLKRENKNKRLSLNLFNFKKMYFFLFISCINKLVTIVVLNYFSLFSFQVYENT